MRISVERGRMLSASCHWMYFILCNTDIMTQINAAPLSLTADHDHKFHGSIFGVRLSLEVLGDREPRSQGEVEIVADVRMPLGLGRTHTIAHYRYRLVERDVTAVDLQLDLETSGIIMGIYALLKRRRIDSYMSHVLSDNEHAAVLVQKGDPALAQLLSPPQLGRIARFRATYGDLLPMGEAASSRDISAQLSSPAKLLWDSELSELTELYTRFHGRADKLENELVRIRETRDAVAALLIARRMLEVIVTHVCERSLDRPRGNEPLAGVIDKIAHAECVPEYVTTSMSNLNRLSTYGAHPKDFSPRQVREALIALCSIIEWYARYSEGGEPTAKPHITASEDSPPRPRTEI